MKKLCIGIIIYFVSCFSLMAEIDVANYPLGMSNDSMHDQLVADGFYFAKFQEKELIAKKTIITGSIGGEYSQIRESTLIKARFCNGKLFEIDMTSAYSKSQKNMLMGRKSIYQYLSDNKAASSGFTLNKNETSSLISHTYIIDRNQSGGQVRGEEEIKLALLESKDLSHTLIDQQKIPVLEIRVLRENKWFCPD